MSANKQQKGLGKGLSALIGDAPTPASGNSAISSQSSGNNVTPTNNNPMELPIIALHPGKYQPRQHFKLDQLQELADSIAHNGIMQPIIVRKSDKGEGYEIVAGERRWRAAKIADLKTVPVIIRNISDKVALELSLVENIQRADLSPVEEASGYQRLMDEFGYTQEELSEIVGKSRSHVANLLRLQGLPQEVKDMLNTGELTMGHARALIGAKDVISLAKDVVQKGLNVRQTEALLKRDPLKPLGRPRKNPGAAPRPASSISYGSKDPDIAALEDSLSENLGLRVSINDQGQNGEIVIQYNTLEQLDDVLRRLGGSI